MLPAGGRGSRLGRQGDLSGEPGAGGHPPLLPLCFPASHEHTGDDILVNGKFFSVVKQLRGKVSVV